mgnify:CR=1 FL=1
MKKQFLSFFIPFGCLFVLFLINNFIFGEKSILYSDSQYQYYQSFLYLKQLIQNGSFYSFQIGLGTPMIATIAYYLGSLSNLLVYFFENIELFLIITSLIKISLCGLTMYNYLKYNYKSKYIIIFSTAYALSFYSLANYFQFMWLDAYFLSPLLLLGIDKIIKEKKYLLYGITLFFIILSNYYMGYMCCLFAVLYFIYKYFLSNKNRKTIKIFIVISILFGLMTMFLHIPNLLELMKIERTSGKNYLFNTDILGILSKIFVGSNVEGGILNYHHPYLYIGIFNIILLLFYFINKKILKKEKILSLGFIVILILSIIFVPFDNLWHALSSPIGYNFRYIYLFNIFIISLCLKSFINIKYIDKIWFYAIFLIFLLISELVLLRDIMNYINIYISIILFLIYLIIFKSNNKDIKTLFIILSIAELFFNGYTIFKKYEFSTKTYLNNIYLEKQNILNDIDDNSFYRLEFLKRFLYNDPLNYDYYGSSGWFSSVYLNKEFYEKIGYGTFNNSLGYNNYLLLDSLFNIKYVASLRELKYYDLVSTNKISAYPESFYGISYLDIYLYKNPYSLSLGYMVSDKIKENFECNNPFDCQNNIINNMTNTTNNIYEEYLYDENIELINQDFYLLSKIANYQKIAKICLSGECFKIDDITNNNLFFENNFENIEIKKENINYIYLAYFNFDEFINKYNILKDNQLNITSFKENHIKGNINVNDNNVLFLSIPYDEGYKILVDNKEVDYYKVIDNFIGLDLENGYHDIEIIYEVKGFKLGLFVSLVAVITFIVIRKHL